MTQASNDFAIRDERPQDAGAIRSLVETAFRQAAHTSHTEQLIVDALRGAGALTVSLVAEARGVLVGHVAVSPVTVSDGSAGWHGLGPIAVLPAWQGRGVGSRLMHAALDRLRASGAQGCVLLGEPAYYGRFGFAPVDGLALPGFPSAYFQALAFGAMRPQGIVSYHPAFTVGS